MMKISKSVRDKYLDLLDTYEKLGKYVDNLILNNISNRWHYESRIKELESFALKIETGRVRNPSELEDLFACMIVVNNLSSMEAAEKLVLEKFSLFERKPRRDDYTFKYSDSFPFDDTRYYVKWKDDVKVKPTGLDGLLFEIQIKTFMAHSWSIATHDMIYKTDEISWPKERVAFQIKAMLEHAEASIQEVECLAKSKTIDKTNYKTETIANIITLIREKWADKYLPENRKGLAENIFDLMKAINRDVDSLKEILEKESILGRGEKTLNLSPFSAIVQSLIFQEPSIMQDFLTGPSKKYKIFIPPEIELPSSIASDGLRNAVSI